MFVISPHILSQDRSYVSFKGFCYLFKNKENAFLASFKNE